MMRTNWDDFLEGIQIKSSPFVCTNEMCESAAHRLNLIRLPPSYCEHAKRLGAGTWQANLHISAPYRIDSDMSLDRYVRIGKEKFHQSISERIEGIDRNLLMRLLVFAHSDEFDLAWDPVTVTREGEMDVFLVTPPEIIVRFVAHDILDFVKNVWADGKLNTITSDIFEGGFECKAVFVPGPDSKFF